MCGVSVGRVCVWSECMEGECVWMSVWRVSMWRVSVCRGGWTLHAPIHKGSNLGAG